MTYPGIHYSTMYTLDDAPTLVFIFVESWRPGSSSSPPQTGSTQYLRMVLHHNTDWFCTIPENGSTPYHRMVLYHNTEWFYTIPQNGSVP